MFLKYTMIGTYLPLLVGNGSRMNVLEIFEAALTNNSKEGFLASGTGFLVRWSLAFGGSIISPDKFIKAICIFIQEVVCIIGFCGNSRMTSYDFFSDILMVIFTLLLLPYFLLLLPPPPSFIFISFFLILKFILGDSLVNKLPTLHAYILHGTVDQDGLSNPGQMINS